MHDEHSVNFLAVQEYIKINLWTNTFAFKPHISTSSGMSNASSLWNFFFFPYEYLAEGAVLKWRLFCPCTPILCFSLQKCILHFNVRNKNLPQALGFCQNLSDY